MQFRHVGHLTQVYKKVQDVKGHQQCFEIIHFINLVLDKTSAQQKYTPDQFTLALSSPSLTSLLFFIQVEVPVVVKAAIMATRATVVAQAVASAAAAVAVTADETRSNCTFAGKVVLILL